MLLVGNEILISVTKLNNVSIGASFGRETNASKAKKTAGLGVLKPLTNITNSTKPSPHKALKKNHSKKSNDIKEQCLHNRQEYINSQTSTTFQGAYIGRKTNGSEGQKKAGLGGSRRALTNITNSKTSPHQALKKSHSKKLNDITKEQFLHNHQECINSQKGGVEMQLLLRTLGIDDDFSMKLTTPAVIPVSRQEKGDYLGSPLKYLEYEEIPELQNEDRSPPRHWISEFPIPSPFSDCYPSPNLALLKTP